jgi:valyl-tRNA synthetase
MVKYVQLLIIDVSGDLPATGYDPIQVEAAHYDWWHAQGYFKPRYQEDGEPLPKGTFSIAFPPPNVTGNLHIGHALTVSLEDTMIRW